MSDVIEKGWPPVSYGTVCFEAARILCCHLGESRRGGEELVEVLKGSGKAKEKSYVVRVRGIGFDNMTVVAKRCSRQTAELEVLVYRSVLERLPITQVCLLGAAEDAEKGVWLFLEDAGDRRLEAGGSSGELAAAWLGNLHALGSELDTIEELPDRGLPDYARHVREARRRFRQVREVGDISDRDATILSELESRLAPVEASWQDMAAFLEPFPRTIIHGDFSGKNVRVRESSSGVEILVVDWEHAGIGHPAVDIASSHLWRYEAPVRTYLQAIHGTWPGLGEQELHAIAQVGRILRLCSSISWAAASLPAFPTPQLFTLLRRYTDTLSESWPLVVSILSGDCDTGSYSAHRSFGDQRT